MVPVDAMPVAARMYAGDHDLRTPTISPLYGDFHGLPPLLIHVSSTEVLYDDARRVVSAAQAAGVDAELRCVAEFAARLSGVRRHPARKRAPRSARSRNSSHASSRERTASAARGGRRPVRQSIGMFRYGLARAAARVGDEPHAHDPHRGAHTDRGRAARGGGLGRAAHRRQRRQRGRTASRGWSRDLGAVLAYVGLEGLIVAALAGRPARPVRVPVAAARAARSARERDDPREGAHAASSRQFEDSEFYDKLHRARREASVRPLSRS